MKEKWRDVVGYERSYQVSNMGQVRSLNRVVRHPLKGPTKRRGRILRANIDGSGYFNVGLSRDGLLRTIRVHKLVATAWLGVPPTECIVRHGPNGCLDNSVSNLCYGTRSEDGLDKRLTGTHGGRAVRRSDGIEFISMTLAAEETGCQRSSIWRVCNGQRKTCGGFSWEYI